MSSLSKEDYILLADDEPIIVKINKFILERNGYQNILQCENVEDAVRIASEYDLGLIVSDYIMYDRTGLELLEEIRLPDGRNREVPFVLYTGLIPKKQEFDIMSRLMAAYLKKPISGFECLENAIRAAEYLVKGNGKACEGRFVQTSEGYGFRCMIPTGCYYKADDFCVYDRMKALETKT